MLKTKQEMILTPLQEKLLLVTEITNQMVGSKLSRGKNPMQKAMIETALKGIVPYVKILKEEDARRFFSDLYEMIPLLLNDTVDLAQFTERLAQVITEHGSTHST